MKLCLGAFTKRSSQRPPAIPGSAPALPVRLLQIFAYLFSRASAGTRRAGDPGLAPTKVVCGSNHSAGRSVAQKRLKSGSRAAQGDGRPLLSHDTMKASGITDCKRPPCSRPGPADAAGRGAPRRPAAWGVAPRAPRTSLPAGRGSGAAATRRRAAHCTPPPHRL